MIGGSYGIGEAIINRLKEDHSITVASRSAPKAHPNVSHIGFDVLSDELSEVTLPEQIDGLVYCPGSIDLKPFHRQKIEQMRDSMDLNAFGLVRVLQSTYSRLKRSKCASVVVFSTVAVAKGMPYHSGVAMAKGAIEGLARSLAAEWAPDIRVNIIAPSLTDTPLASKWLSSQDKRDRMATRHPMKKIGTAADVSALGAYLLSDESNWMTGQTLAIDGGLSTLKLD